MIDLLVQVPEGWTVESPPDGVALVAVHPDVVPGAVRPNLVVTMVDRPGEDDVDGYLDRVLARLLLDLQGAQLVDAWTVDRDMATTTDGETSGAPILALSRGQRFVLHHRVEGTPVSTVQQHTWIDDTIVVVTATTAVDAPDALVTTLCRCLDSVVVAA